MWPSYMNGEVALAWLALGSIVEGFNARWRITCLVIPATLVGVMIHWCESFFNVYIIDEINDDYIEGENHNHQP